MATGDTTVSFTLTAKKKLILAIVVVSLATGVLCYDKIDQNTYQQIVASVVSMFGQGPTQ